jgi:hypothetical protein
MPHADKSLMERLSLHRAIAVCVPATIHPAVFGATAQERAYKRATTNTKSVVGKTADKFARSRSVSGLIWRNSGKRFGLAFFEFGNRRTKIEASALRTSSRKSLQLQIALRNDCAR